MSFTSIRIWDNFIRIYHIAQLILIALLWYSAEQADFELHFVSGFTLASLWLARIIWGFVGSDTARFSHFVVNPYRVIQAWRTNLVAKPHSGHNPVSGYMVLALLIVLAVQFISGLFATDDVFAEGPFYALASESVTAYMDSIHSSNINLLWGLIVLHALAGIFHSIRGDHVIKAIITGKKRMPAQTSPDQLKFKSATAPLCLWLASALLCTYFGLHLSSY
ncbi:cytochrome b/b6 domain-containing protein [Thalassotalea ponticola]|uniref:cytochrome b/b6 domain-containing protein n=1 Tax=Thalassotalea ponticola TaxID=1523392 RepID=UPI0025B4F9FA|nr:cytochrome b/b6 domain-containing protein [Thalassotalea ponticola]MDN3653487.1 cytochrome b/b6 domain-containing protein [Thalassotalea ponticola]